MLRILWRRRRSRSGPGNRGVKSPAGNGSDFLPKKFGTKPPPPGPRQKGRPYPHSRGAFFKMPRRDFRRPHSHACRSRFRHAVRQLRSRSENPAVTLQAGTASSAVKTDLVSANATFVATDRATVHDHKIPPEFFQAKTPFTCARVFSRIKPSGPNRKPGICAYSPAGTFQAVYCIRSFDRSRPCQTSCRRLPLKIPPGLFRLFTVSGFDRNALLPIASHERLPLKIPSGLFDVTDAVHSFSRSAEPDRTTAVSP